MLHCACSPGWPPEAAGVQEYLGCCAEHGTQGRLEGILQWPGASMDRLRGVCGFPWGKLLSVCPSYACLGMHNKANHKKRAISRGAGCFACV
eukprot:1156115-Pelagomonas_calceolata.AAC.5